MKIIKAQALVRSFIARQTIMPERMQLEKEFKMLYRSQKKMQDGKVYHIFLMGKDPQLIDHDDDVLYQITVRDTNNKENMFDLHISHSLAKEIFSTESCSEEELEEVLIVYKLNKGAFLNMLSSLNIQDGKFTIDFSIINKFKEVGDASSRVLMEESFTYNEGNGSNDIPDFREDFSVIESSNRVDN
jgi:hypothetical protein